MPAFKFERKEAGMRAIAITDYDTHEHNVTAVHEPHPDRVNALIDLVNQADGFAPRAELVSGGAEAAPALGAAGGVALSGRTSSATNVIASADASAIAQLAELVAGGEVEPTIDAVLTFEETPASIEQSTAVKRGTIAISLADRR
jgi:NADPH:quinone reductase-like Zn-dependent oxidoreductase